MQVDEQHELISSLRSKIHDISQEQNMNQFAEKLEEMDGEMVELAKELQHAREK